MCIALPAQYLSAWGPRDCTTERRGEFFPYPPWKLVKHSVSRVNKEYSWTRDIALHWVEFANASQLPVSFSSCFVANHEAPEEGSGSQTLCDSDGLAAHSSPQPHASVHSVTSWCGCFGGAAWGSRLQLLLKDINMFSSWGAPAVQQGQGHLGSIPGSPADLLHCFTPFSSSKWRPFPAKFVFLGVRLPPENLSHSKEFGVMGLACEFKPRH